MLWEHLVDDPTITYMNGVQNARGIFLQSEFSLPLEK